MSETMTEAIAYEGCDFRVRRQEAEESGKSREFVDHRASVTIMAMTKATLNGEVVVIEDEQPVYGDDRSKIRLPGGTVRGSFDVSEAPLVAGLRLMCEATGYNRDSYPEPYNAPDTSLFVMPNSNTRINHPRYLLWVRNVVRRSMPVEDNLIGTEPVGALFVPVFKKLITPHFPAEAVLGFSMATDKFGEGGLLTFLMAGQDYDDFDEVTEAMQPWLTLVPDQE